MFVMLGFNLCTKLNESYLYVQILYTFVTTNENKYQAGNTKGNGKVQQLSCYYLQRMIRNGGGHFKDPLRAHQYTQPQQRMPKSRSDGLFLLQRTNTHLKSLGV